MWSPDDVDFSLQLSPSPVRSIRSFRLTAQSASATLVCTVGELVAALATAFVAMSWEKRRKQKKTQHEQDGV